MTCPIKNACKRTCREKEYRHLYEVQSRKRKNKKDQLLLVYYVELTKKQKSIQSKYLDRSFYHSIACNTMFPSKRALFNLATYSFVHARPRYFHSHHDYVVACFSSFPDRKRGGTNPGNLTEKDSTVGGSEGGYGGSGISSTENKLPGGSRDGPGGWNAAGRTVDGEDKRGEWRRDTEDAARDTGGSVAEMAKAGAVGAVETGLKLGEVAKQTMDGMWDAAKETTENVRDTVADDSETIDGRTRTSNDKHVEDLRRRAGGYDLKD